MKNLFIALVAFLFLGTAYAGETKGQIQSQEFKLDLSESSQTSGTFSLGTMPTGAVVKDVWVKVTTALSSSASVSMTFGNTNDSDGMIEAFEAKSGTAAANYTKKGFGAKVWDDTNDYQIPYILDGSDEDDIVAVITQGSASSGVFSFIIDYYIPKY